MSETRYELIDKDGNVVPGTYPTAISAAAAAMRLWPDEPQDEEHAGNGWDIQVAEEHR